MIKIAICDDNHTFLQELKQLIRTYLKAHSIQGEIYTYEDGELFLKSFQKDYFQFDMVFLDIDMPAVDGIEAAHHIRMFNKNLILVFLTSMENRVYETFQFNTFRFIRKKYILEELEECLDKAVELLNHEHEIYAFKTKEGMIKLSLHDILYFTFINRHVEIWTLHKQYTMLNNRFQDIIDLFKDKNFVCIHRGCMVNVKYIKAINKLFIVLDNNEKLSISRYKVDEVFKAFANYAK